MTINNLKTHTFGIGSLILSLLPFYAWSEHITKEERTTYLGNYPIYSISVRKEDTHDTLDEVDPKYFSIKRPYADPQPTPFYYREDVEAFKRDENQNKKGPFLIGGINCDETIKEVKTITGVKLEYLKERVKGLPDKGQFAKRQGLSWEGLNNTNFRSSGEGFVKPEQDLRDLLLSDNKLVREMNLTHQQVAEPLLVGITSLKAKRATDLFSGTVQTPVDFKFGNQEYSIYSFHMGGSIKLGSLATLPKEKKEWERVLLARYAARPAGTAWIGAGVQGSVFNDELFEDEVFTITRKSDGKKLTKDMLTPHLIYRYGFYQGGDYRIDPKEVADFFGLLENKKARETTKELWKTACSP